MTLNALRNNKETLMSVLESFIHDPLVEWSNASGTSKRGERENHKGLDLIRRIEHRLQGKVGDGHIMAVEGQVRMQIEQATSIQHLGTMYLGWAPYL
jgi:serine/threonine-protein kinase ATR